MNPRSVRSTSFAFGCALLLAAIATAQQTSVTADDMGRPGSSGLDLPSATVLAEVAEKLDGIGRHLRQAELELGERTRIGAVRRAIDYAKESVEAIHVILDLGSRPSIDQQGFQRLATAYAAMRGWPPGVYSIVRARMVSVADPWADVPPDVASDPGFESLKKALGPGQTILARILDAPHLGNPTLAVVLSLGFSSVQRRDLARGKTVELYHLGGIPDDCLVEGREYWLMLGAPMRGASFIKLAKPTAARRRVARSEGGGSASGLGRPQARPRPSMNHRGLRGLPVRCARFKA